jgi:hypothetical protein
MCQHLRAWQTYQIPCSSHTPERGYLEVLKFLREGGCAWDAQDALITAAECADIAMMRYVIEQAQPSQHQLQQMLLTVGAQGNLAALQWLKAEHSVEWPQYLSCWEGAVLDWAKQAGCTASHIDPDLFHGELS